MAPSSIMFPVRSRVGRGRLVVPSPNGGTAPPAAKRMAEHDISINQIHSNFQILVWVIVVEIVPFVWDVFYCTALLGEVGKNDLFPRCSLRFRQGEIEGETRFDGSGRRVRIDAWESLELISTGREEEEGGADDSSHQFEIDHLPQRDHLP